MRRCWGLIFGTAIVLAACATQAPPDVPRTAAPPPIAAFLARYQDGRLCEMRQAHQVISGADANAAALTARLCTPVFPQELVARGYTADCTVRFQLGPEGVAKKPRGACQVLGAVSPDWDAFARDAFIRLAEMSVQQTIYSDDPNRQPSAGFQRRFVFALD